jgi:dihydrofolate reductase
VAAEVSLPDNQQGESAGQVFLHLSMSLDGFAAGPNIGHAHPLGAGGERLHAWMADDPAIAAEFFAGTGAFVLGRRMFDLGIDLWGEDGTFGRPCFVLTHRERAVLRRGPTTFTFVGDGIASALAQARAVAGEKNVCVAGGPTLAQQYLAAGLIDEVRIQLIPVLLGAGTRLFDNIGGAQIELERTRQIATPAATHLGFRVVKETSPENALRRTVDLPTCRATT